MANFFKVLTEAIDDFVEHGFSSQQQLEDWLARLRESAKASMVPEYVLQRSLTKALKDAYNRSVNPKTLAKVHPGVSLYTIENIKPKLRAELDRRILASANLITLNRQASIARTLQRFAGWSTSIPKGGTDVAKRKEVKQSIRRCIAGLPFEERRVVIDQAHKLSVAVSDIVAVDGGAIVAKWQHVREGGGYQARPAHEERSGTLYVIRGSWADKAGYIKGLPYSDTVEQPAELINCRCRWIYGFTLRDVPVKNRTAKGMEALLEARNKLRAVS